MDYFQQQADQERKRFLMWLWVAIIASAIFIGWIFTFRATARQILSQAPSLEEQQTIKSFQEQWNTSLVQFKRTWETVKEPDKDIPPPPALTAEQLNDVKTRLQKALTPPVTQ